MTGISRFNNILQLFDHDHREWTIPDMATATGAPASTVYRTVRELLNTGFLESTVDSRYRLGPAFIDFDRRLRISDPLLRAGEIFLRSLVEQVQVPCYAVLSRLYGDTVMCVSDAKSTSADFRTSYERGRPMPLLRGATSKAILARLSDRRLGKLLTAENGEPPTSETVKALEEQLLSIRKSGYCVTSGEVDQGLTGFAASIHNKALGMNASLSLIVRTTELTEERRMKTLAPLLATARLIDDFMQKDFDSHHASAGA